tara:strand:- start:184 stop:504 length:321 start_codon:yes stop_codon:yes gene_type:complete
MKNFFLLIFMINLLLSCKSVSEGFKLKKGNNADEFLVEKKNPLVLPPDFNQLPIPGNTENLNKNKDEKFKILTDSKVKLEDKNDDNILSNSTEEFILKNIKKNESN